MSPAPIDFKILNFLTFFGDNPLVSFAKRAKPSNAVLLDNGFFAGDKIFVNTSGGAVTITLPATAAVGDEIRFNDVANNFDTHNLTVARNSHKIDGATSDLTVATEGAGFALVYSGATFGWKLLEK